MNPLESSGAVSPAEGHDGVLTIRGGGDSRSWNGIRYKAGLSGKNVGAQHLSLNVATIPPGGVAYVSYNTLPGWGLLGGLREGYCKKT